MNEIQKKKLQKLFIYLRANNDYYNHMFKEKQIIFDGDMEKELLKMPILNKEDIRKNADTYYSNTDEEVLTQLTSGSVGIPMQCKKTTSERSYAAMKVWKKRIKIDPWVRPNNFFSFFGHSQKAEMGDFINLNTDQLLQYFKNILIREYRWISGPLSTIYEMAKLIDNGMISNTCIKVIELFGEFSTQEQRDYIEKMFNCITVVHYGTRETWCIAYECKHRKLHIQDDMFFVELNHNNVHLPDSSGEIIITSLYNYYMPFIRYNLQDIGKLTYGQCKCGNHAPYIELAGGRTAELIKGKNLLGVNLFNRAIGQLIKAGYDCIERFKVAQIGLNEFNVYIVKSENYDMNANEYLKKIIMQSLGEDVKINIIFVNELLPLPSGKYKNFECLMGQSEVL